MEQCKRGSIMKRHRCNERGGNAAREAVIQQQASARDVGTKREEAMQQPFSLRESWHDKRDGGVTREGWVVRQGGAH
jgi:hypothetical protein